MRVILFYLFVILSAKNVFAQDYPLDDDAFTKMMIDQYGYTILGSQSPSTGLKVETVNPSITLSGTLFKNSKGTKITNLEISGGTLNGFMDIFSLNQLNGYFKGAVSFNFLTAMNSAFYNKSYNTPIKQRDIELMETAFNLEATQAYIYLSLLDKAFLDIPTPTITDLIKVYAAKRNICKSLVTVGDFSNETKNVITSHFSFINTSQEINVVLKDFTDEWKMMPAPTAIDPLHANKITALASYDKQLKIASMALDSIRTLKIKTFKKDYSDIRIIWVNVTPSFSNSSLKLYHPTDSTLNDKSSFLFGGKLGVNYFKQDQKNKTRFTYGIFGVGLRRVNTLEELDKFNYKKTVQIKPTSNETLTSEKTGTAYKGVTNNHGLGIDVFLEGYLTRTTRYLPGLYAKIQYSHSKIWLNDRRLSTELGTIFNVANATKDSKNALSIIPFAAFSNLLEQREHDDHSKTVPLRDLFSIGVKFGVPINIGK